MFVAACCVCDVQMASALWVFYFSKVPEFMDTFLMALKRNFHQITFLHVYHHSSIFLIWWLIISYAPSVAFAHRAHTEAWVHRPCRSDAVLSLTSRASRNVVCVYFVAVLLLCCSGGSSYWSAALNSFVHVGMYGYYLWASLSSSKRDPTRRPRWTEPAYWRQSITTMQLIQFCLNFTQAIYLLAFHMPKGFPAFTVWILLVYMITMLALFGNFYCKAYGGGAAKKARNGGEGATNGKHKKDA
jgi:elongation of very long chain fatty acids protein 4